MSVVTQFGVHPSGPMARLPSRPHNIWSRIQREKAERRAAEEKHRAEVLAALERRRNEELDRKRRMACDRQLAAFGVITLPRPTMRQIIYETAVKHHFTVEEMLSRRRFVPLVRARQEAMWRCAKETTRSLLEIGRAFKKDHTTVLHGVRRHEARRQRGEA